MVEHTIDSLYIDIQSDSQSATKALGKLISSLKVLKKELGGNFNTNGFKSALGSLDKINSKTKDIAKNTNLDKLSESLTKATNVKTDSLDKYKQSLNGLFKGVQFKIPDTLPKIEKELDSLVVKYEELINRQNKAVTTNGGVEPDTKGYRGLLYDINELIAKTHAISKARLEASQIAEHEKPDTQISANEPEDVAKGFDKLADSAEKASESIEKVSKANVKVDDPTSRLREFMEKDEQRFESIAKDLAEKARANVQENFIIPESIKNSESALNSFIGRLAALRESMQQAFDLNRIEEGSKRWEDYQYRIAAVTEKIESVKNSLAELKEQNNTLVSSEQFAKNQEQNAQKVSDTWKKAYENIQKNFKVPDTIKALEKSIPTLEKNISKLYESFQKDIDTGKVDEQSKAWSDYEYKIGMANAKLDITKEKLEKLLAIEREMSETQITPVESGESLKSTGSGKDVSTKALTATVSFATLSKMVGKFSKSLDGLASKMTGVLSALYTPLRKVVAEYRERLANIGNIFKKLSDTVDKSVSKIRSKWNNLVHSFSKMVMRRALYAVLQTINDAMGSLANFVGVTGQKFNAAMSDMTSNARYAGANIVAAFSPLVNAIAPMIDALVAKMVSAITVINQFFAALTGNNVYVRAKKVVTDYGESVKKATKAQKDLVLAIDELNINKPDEDTASGGGAGTGDLYEWEEAPVVNKIKEFADKVKDILSKLFDPLKKAWDNAGDYVISGFKYMAGELGKLAADIGRDFLIMWQEDATVRIFENILGIIGDIEYTIGNLARNFREAWNENNVGLEIFRNMRDIIGILVDHVRNVTKYMKQWSESVDFTPMLTSFNNLLESLKPVADFIGGVFEDLMKNIVIKYIDWMIEEGIPHLNNTLASIADAFNWGKMRSDMEPVEKAFERLAENIETGVVNALGNLGRSLAGITNTETFTKFLENIAKVMDLIDAELVEKFLTALGNCILDIAEALISFVGSDSFSDFLDDVKLYLKNITVEDIEKKIKGLAIAIAAFKFAGFLGNGVGAVTKFLTFISTLKGLTGVSGGLTAVGTSLLGLTEATVIIAGVFFHLENLAKLFNNIKDAIDKKDLPKLIGNVGLAFLAILNPLASAGIGIAKFVYDTGVQFGILKKDGKSLRDSVEENTKASSNALRDQRKVTEEETKTIGEKFKSLTESVKLAGQNMKENIIEAFGNLGEKVSKSFGEVKENAERIWDNIKETVKEAINKIKGMFDFEWKWPEIKLPHIRIEGEFNLFEGKIPWVEIDWYKNGGFLGSPSSYSLFGMGENGIPEILGTVGGRSAVAGGEEITGIRDQVYQTGIAVQEIMMQQTTLLQAIADKDFNVDLDGRSMVSALSSRSSRNGYSMATVS